MNTSLNNIQSYQEKIESLTIKQDNKDYILLIKIIENKIILSISDSDGINNLIYSREITLQEIKEKYKIFSMMNTTNEFLDYLKALSNEQKLFIIKQDNKIYINFNVEYFLKKEKIEFELFQNKINVDLIINDLCKEINLLKDKINIFGNQNKEIKNENEELKNNKINSRKEIDEIKNEIKKIKEEKLTSIEELKNENKNLKIEINKVKNENINLKEEIKEIKKIIKSINNKEQENKTFNKIFNNKSVIMKENEFNWINIAIKSRINKEIKEIKKLYQASIDGDGAINFHNKCDNIPNTLVLIKSAENRRFGGFTTQIWEYISPPGKWKDDKNAFLFSLDKQKIYKYKNNGCAIYCHKDNGPVFGNGCDIAICNNVIQEKQSYTSESKSSCSYEFNGDKNALSESNISNIYLFDYEVFEVIFS